jgi:hypothetical protein
MLSEWRSPVSLVLAAALAAAIVVPLSVPAVRRRVFPPAPLD